MRTNVSSAVSIAVLILGVSAGCQTGGSTQPMGAGTATDNSATASTAEVGDAAPITTASATAQTAEVGDAAPITTGSATLWVHGMSCPLCATNIDKQLSKVPGVKNVSVDLGSGRVVVDLKDQPKPSRAALSKAIRDSGFTLTRIETP